MFFISEKLYNSTGRDLRRALFSLKQIFQVKKKKKNTVRFCFCIAVGLDADKFMLFTDYKKRNALEYKVNFGQNIS